MLVIANHDRWDKSNAIFRDGSLIRYDTRTHLSEMAHIDYGVALLRRTALERIPANEPYDLADLYRNLVDEKQMAGHEVSQRFYEIGSPAGLQEHSRGHLQSRGYGSPHSVPMVSSSCGA